MAHTSLQQTSLPSKDTQSAVRAIDVSRTIDLALVFGLGTLPTFG